MKKLLIITSGFPNKYDKVEGVFVYDQVFALSKYFDKITVIRPQLIVPKYLRFLKVFPDSWKKLGRKDYKKENVEVLFPEVSWNPYINKKQILNFVNKKKIDFDIINSHFVFPSGIIGNYIAKKKKKKSVITGHGFDVYILPFKNIFWRIIIKQILKNCDNIITVSKSNFKKLKELGFDNKTRIIPNGFNNDLFKPMNKKECREKLGLPINKKIILNVGNLVPIKNQESLILAVKELLENRKDVLCLIIGKGPLAKEFKKLIRWKKLEEYVKLIGEVPHDKLVLWMNSADLFVLPSKRESFGIVQIEAMACGVPVVATRNGGSEEIITKDNGLFSKKDYISIAKNIEKCLNRNWNKHKIIKSVKKYKQSEVSKKIFF